ncbi:MAG: histidine phosphatase family protein [bacterium]|nr:histidine phosphatase family protein [bacterium]
MIKRVIFIRTGETEWNKHGRWQGWVAVPLNAHGKAQAAALARVIRHMGVGALYASDLKRAADTAAPIAQETQITPVYDARLRERSVGLWQGLTLEEIRDWYGDEYAALLADREGYTMPGGESRGAVRERVKQAFREIMSQAASETIAIVSHTTAIMTMLTELIPTYNPTGVDLDNTSVTTIRAREDGQWELVAVDDTMHLDGLIARAVGELEK